MNSRVNYAYTRFEEIHTCAGEVLFTNEHKAVFSRKEADCYIPIKDLDIFKDLFDNTKTIFMIKPITAKITKIINAKNIDDSYFLKEKTRIAGNIYYVLSNYILEMYDDNEEICCLYNRYYIFDDKEKKDDILKKIKEKTNNLLDKIWNIVYKKRKTDTAEVKTDKNKDINKYLHELKKFTEGDYVRLLDAASMIQGLIEEIKDTFHQAVVTLRLDVNTDKKLIKSLEKIFKNHNNEVLKRLRETAGSLTCKQTTNNV